MNFADDGELNIKLEIWHGGASANIIRITGVARCEPKLWSCAVAAFFGRVVPFLRGVAALARVAQRLTTPQWKCQKSDGGRQTAANIVQQQSAAITAAILAVVLFAAAVLRLPAAILRQYES
ncbi:hypothetical protein B0H11DRAFT_1925634 [Mycena galericulata]|nr:hypothetical protein B0H11DRAFT_1925634 [Mycena galericulata]